MILLVYAILLSRNWHLTTSPGTLIGQYLAICVGKLATSLSTPPTTWNPSISPLSIIAYIVIRFVQAKITLQDMFQSSTKE